MSTLAIVSQSGESLSFFDRTGTRSGKLEGLTAEPHELLYDERTNLLYISHAYAHGWYQEHGRFVQQISVLDCHLRRVVETIDISPAGGTHGLALDTERDILYVSVEDGLHEGPNAGGIIGIDLQTRTVIKSISSGHRTHWFVMTQDGNKAFTCNKEAEYISVLDLKGEKLVGTIPMQGGCEQPGITRDGKLAYFPTPGMGEVMSRRNGAALGVQVIDTATDAVIQTIPLDSAPVGVHVDVHGRLLVGQYAMTISSSGAITSQSGGLAVFASAAEGYRRLGYVETGEVPLTVFSTPDGETAYVANIFRGTVAEISLASLEIERVLEVDLEKRADKKFHNGAHGMALIP